MAEGREEPGSVTLPTGKVLIVGGYNETAKYLKTAELFNPETNTFEKLSTELTEPRDGPAVALLADGRVLIVGGYNETSKYLGTAELFIPTTGTFEKVAGQMATARGEPAAATLPNGKVVVAGGYNTTAKQVKTAELFNPASGTFESLPAEMSEPRDEMGYVGLANGKMLIVGGYNDASKSLKTAELFNPETNTFEKLSTELTEVRDYPAATLLADGRVLIVGGASIAASPYLKTAEVTSVTPPAATTASASGVGLTSATLNAAVLGETASSAYFQYGTTTAYGASTPHQTVAASINGRPVATSVGGLSSGTTYHFRIVAENAGGPSYGADLTFTTAPATSTAIAPPTVSELSQSHRRWREGNRLAQISKKQLPLGTTFSFTLNEQARVSFVFSQQVAGRRVSARCVAQTKTNRHRRACKRTLTRGTLGFTGHPGTNKVSFQGRISRSNKLRPGSYTLAIVATNSTGQRSSPAQLTFTVVS